MPDHVELPEGMVSSRLAERSRLQDAVRGHERPEAVAEVLETAAPYRRHEATEGADEKCGRQGAPEG